MALHQQGMEIEILLHKHTFLPQDHTGVNILETLQSILESWSLPENKLSYITTNNGSNVTTAAVETLGWNGLSCFSHNLCIFGHY